MTSKAGIALMSETHSINDIRTAIRELTVRAELARKEGRPGDADEIEARIAAKRQELSERP
jgi:hypothetical protein